MRYDAFRTYGTGTVGLLDLFCHSGHVTRSRKRIARFQFGGRSDTTGRNQFYPIAGSASILR